MTCEPHPFTEESLVLRFPLLVALAAAATGCARSSMATPPPTSPSASPAAAASAARSPVGVYDYSAQLQGQDVTGTITITSAADGTYGGQVTVSTLPEPLPVTSVTTEGEKLTVSFTSPQGPSRMEIQLSGVEFTGQWFYADQSSPLRGKRRGA